MSDDIVNDDWNFPIMAAMKKERKVAADLTARVEQAEAERDELKRQAQLYHADMMKVRSQRDIAEAERDAWKKFALHQVFCATCADSVHFCDYAIPMMVAIRKIDDTSKEWLDSEELAEAIEKDKLKGGEA